MEISAGGRILIHHLQWGRGRDVIFLHGWGGSTASFLGAARALGESFRVTLVDFYGFGGTPHPDYPLFVEDFAKSVAAIINHYKMTRVTLVGHSFGGRVAIRLASRYGYLVDSVVLADSAGILPRRGVVYRAKILRHKLLTRLGVAHSAGSPDYRALSGAMKETFKNVVNEDLSFELDKITLPVLIIWGDKDRDTPIYMAKRMYRKIRNSGLVVFRGAGHYAYLEAHALFLSVLVQFISGGGYEVDNSGIDNRSNRGGVVKISLPVSK